ncbi:MAG TPA: hypothetical protein VGR69_10335 [Candidatus Rubrimentiphilum sp.]|nr:hypothetical protein [Candidatus Rubrimentiphilum sp.]
MTRWILSFSVTMFVFGSSIAVAQKAPEYYLLANNRSDHQARIIVHAGSSHKLTLAPHEEGQLIFRVGGTSIGAFVKCEQEHMVILHLKPATPTIHMTISQGCKTGVTYGPEPMGRR